jgi:hypothetical protein
MSHAQEGGIPAPIIPSFVLLARILSLRTKTLFANINTKYPS